MQRKSQTVLLLRFDDICPTMNWSVWSDVEAILVENNVQPVLAVVPDNQDPVLTVDTPAPDFWDRVRAWQERGWAIALHGYQHRYVSANSGIFGLREKSEFAGLSAPVQEEKLRCALAIFRQQGIMPAAWVAPLHTFDVTTVALLSNAGVNVILDGMFCFPYRDRDGVAWVPVQLSCFRPLPPGVWTICLHHNEWNADRVRRFANEVAAQRELFLPLDKVLACHLEDRPRFDVHFARCPRLVHSAFRIYLKLWAMSRFMQGSN